MRTTAIASSCSHFSLIRRDARDSAGPRSFEGSIKFLRAAFIAEKVHTIVETNRTGGGSESNFKKMRVLELRRRPCFSCEFVTATSSDVSSCSTVACFLVLLHLVPVCLSRRCWTGFVNHAVRIARIIPRSCGIIKEVLPGTISSSSTGTCAFHRG